jgi:hypothetical protein
MKVLGRLACLTALLWAVSLAQADNSFSIRGAESNLKQLNKKCTSSVREKDGSFNTRRLGC